MNSSWKLGLSFSLLTATIWALLPLALKGVLEAMDSVTITWYRLLGSTLIALIWYGHRSGPALKRLLSGKQLVPSLIAITGLLGNYYFYIVGLEYITPSAAQVVIQVAPLLLLIGSIIIFNDRLCMKQWLGVAGFSIGMVLFFHLRLTRFVSTGDGYVWGIVLILAASITWAAYALAQKQLLISEHSNDLLLLIYIVGSISFLPFAEPSQIFSLDGEQLALLAFVTLCTVVAYGSFGYALIYWEASRVSASVTVSPLLTLLFSQILIWWQPNYITGEPLDWLSWTGAVMVVVGSLIAALAKSAKPA